MKSKLRIFLLTFLVLGVLSLLGIWFLAEAPDTSAGSDAGVITGTVISPSGTADVLVLLYRLNTDSIAPDLVGISQLSDLQKTFGFVAETSESYRVAAFRDSNDDGRWQPGEDLGIADADDPRPWPTGVVARDISLELVADASPPDGLRLEAAAEMDRQTALQLSVGEVVSLADERFSPRSAAKGLWRPLRALGSSGAGVYFLEPYDPQRIPVLFVHGIGGTPRDFKTLIDNLDHVRYQAWAFHYPSGFRLRTIAGGLLHILNEIREQIGFQRVHVVAHSMGGLISRSMLHQLQATPEHRDMVDLLVTFSTPLEGHSAVKWGLRFTPEPVPAWIDIEPGSAFLAEISEPLPSTVSTYLLFGYHRGASVLMPASHDGTVAVHSQVPLWAQRQAAGIWGFDEGHMGILSEPEPVSVFREILARE